MRKLIPLMLAIALLLSMNVHPVVQATENSSVNESAQVKGTYVPGEKGGQIISVDVAWEGMNFTYNDASEKIWDADKHQYSAETKAAWSESNAYISITNHSNVMLSSALTYAAKDTKYATMGLAFADDKPYVGSAETSEDAGSACCVVIRVIPTGSLPSDTPAGAVVGEIQLTMTPTENYSTVMTALKGYENVAVKTGETTLDAGVRYFSSQTVKDQVRTAYNSALDVVSDAEFAYEKNEVINQVITAFYNNLYLVQ